MYFFQLFPRILSNFSTIDQYFISSKHSNKPLVEDGGFAQNNSRISTDNSIVTNFGKRVEHTL